MSNQWVKVLAFSLWGCLGVIPPATAEMMATQLQEVLISSQTVIQGQCIGLDEKTQRYLVAFKTE